MHRLQNLLSDYKLFNNSPLELDENSNDIHQSCIMNNNNNMEQPDPDNIKMFVGQVPHDMDENDLRALFEEFGRVHQINILRDKVTGSHRVTVIFANCSGNIFLTVLCKEQLLE